MGDLMTELQRIERELRGKMKKYRVDIPELGYKDECEAISERAAAVEFHCRPTLVDWGPNELLPYIYEVKDG